MIDLAAFAAGLPEADLHLPIERSLEPERMFAPAARNKVAIRFVSVIEWLFAGMAAAEARHRLTARCDAHVAAHA